MSIRATEASPRVYARVAGVAYIVITLAGVLGVALLDSHLVVSGNDAATANNILAEAIVGASTVLVSFVAGVVCHKHPRARSPVDTRDRLLCAGRAF